MGQTSPISEEPKPRKTSSVRHTRASQRDRSKQPLREPLPEEVETLLEQLVSPIVYSQCASYQAMGLRQRILTLPVMVAFVLSLIWRQVGSVTEAVRELNKRRHLVGAAEDRQSASGLGAAARFPARVVPPGAAGVAAADAPALANAKATLELGHRPRVAALCGGVDPGWLDPGQPAAQSGFAARGRRNRAGRSPVRFAECGQPAAGGSLVRGRQLDA